MPATRRARAKPAARPTVRRKPGAPGDNQARKPLGVEIIGLGVMTLGILLLLATQWHGAVLDILLRGLQWAVGRWGAYGFAVALILLGVAIMVRQRVRLSIPVVGMALLFLAAIGMLQLTHQPAWYPAAFSETPGGMLGGLIAGGLYRWLGELAWVMLGFIALCGVAMVTDIPLWALLLYPCKVLYLTIRWGVQRSRAAARQRDESRRAAPIGTAPDVERGRRARQEPEPAAAPPPPSLPMAPPPVVTPLAPPPLEEEEPEIAAPPASNRQYALPSVELLALPPRSAATVKDDSGDKAAILEEKLRSFGIEAKVVGIERGPRVTRFEILPPPGVRISKITNLSDDLALSLAVLDVRVEAPVPGKGVVGIEVPNKELAMVSLREIIDADVCRKSRSPLAFALGRDIAGIPRIADLTKMPHLLIAGATNSGKSVCINSLLCTILMRATPQQVKFLLVDPKRVELSLFQHIPHLIAPVAYDAKHAAGLLRWAIREMEERYQMFAEKGVRNIVGFNEQSKMDGLEELPYIVIIIDELADLMMQAAAEFEASICRIAQLARATGIHLVVATQRPSVNVITGTIKANIPSRIAFAVASQVDSRTILDMNGAERLVGQGDMLYLPVDASKPTRIQGAYVSEVEINKIVTHVKGQGKPVFSDEIVAIEEEAMRADGDDGGYNDEPEDELFDKALDYIRTTKYASTSMLQRKFRIGYTRAARLMDIFEERGFVGPGQGSKPREVIFAPAGSVVGRPAIPEMPEDEEAAPGGDSG